MFKRNLFKAKLAEFNMTTEMAARIIGCNVTTLYRKLNGESDFTRNEIQLFRKKLNLTAQEIESIFFAP
ncbi:hypothetical protein [uncultured Allofournierella sp.]|uniref:hypothetical protein n=1 Tax=uncultured Allofournierella sp. TaxID=1940258 RepID=UPI00375010CB